MVCPLLLTKEQYENFRRGNAGENGKQLYEKKDSGFSKHVKNEERIVQGERPHEHHSDPEFLGGAKKQELTEMNAQTHRDLHRDMNDFLKSKKDEFGNTMRPGKNNSGEDIQQAFGRENCISALCEFYRGPGAVYEDAARDFFKQHLGKK